MTMPRRGDGTQSGCHYTGAESAECFDYCPFAGGQDEEYEDDE